MKIGDTVSVIDDDIQGIITKIEGENIHFQTNYGFTETYPKSQLVLRKNTYEELENIPQKEIDFQVPKKVKKAQKADDYIEIDLHIEQLIDDYKSLSNYQILQIQLDKAQFLLEKLLEEKNYKRIIFIHGFGDGVLKKALHELLDRYALQCHYFDASFRKYKLGATEVEIF